MSTAQKLQLITENMQSVHDAGYQKAESLCRSRHYAAMVTGDGTGELTFPLPFEPDLIEIVCHDPDIRMHRGMIAFAQLDFSALGQLAGMFGIASGPGSDTTSVLSTYSNVLMAVTSLAARCRKNDDGTMTVTNLSYNTLQGVWGEGVEYKVIAVKCVEKSDKERLTQIVQRLPVGGVYNIHIAQDKKNAAFTDEQWQALIATRDTYTFIMV